MTLFHGLAQKISKLVNIKETIIKDTIIDIKDTILKYRKILSYSKQIS